MESDTSNHPSIVACVFVAAVKLLPIRCLATIEDKHTDTQTNGRNVMKYTVEMGSGAMRLILSFIKIGSGIQKLIGGIYRHTHRKKSAQAYFRKVD
jgi:hypothetical protein